MNANRKLALKIARDVMSNQQEFAGPDEIAAARPYADALITLRDAAAPFDKGCHVPECKLRQAIQLVEALTTDAPEPVESMKGGAR
jgi:hypothetical protein